jgi:diguanylate cyclase (GGDEF)-like protein
MASPAHRRVLTAHGDAAVREKLQAWLTDWGYDVVGAADGVAAWDQLRRDDAPRFVLLATDLAGLRATDVCRAARERPMEPYAYIAFIAPQGAPSEIDACHAAEADDYMVWPVEPELLRLRLEASQRVAQMQDDLIAARESLRSRAASDALTGTWNRETVLSILSREMGRAEREDGLVAVMMADVDHFKRINDDFGHQSGDQVLREVARRMSGVIRPYDAVGRYGGEEFLFVLPGCDRARAAAAAERVVEAVSAEPIGLPNATLRATVSVGVSATGPDPKLGFDEVVHAADAALYRAKRAGRNRVVVDRLIEPTTEAQLRIAQRPQTAQMLLAQLRTAVTAHDLHAVLEQTRGLRRLAAEIGAKGVIHLTRTLDSRAEAGHWDTALGAVDAIGAEVVRFTAQPMHG